MTEERKPRSNTRSVDEPLVFPGNMFQNSNNKGLSKREHFASLILAGMNANPDPQFSQLTHVEMIERSIEQADLLIEALVKADREDA